jgi:phosphatidylserine decarboxylase
VRLDPAGLPFITGALALAAIAGAAGQWVVAAAFVVLAALFSFFFRDPERQARTADDETVLAPADGRVIVAGPALAEVAPPGDWLQVSIFLSPFDVHVNRVPVSGRVLRVSHTPGRFLPAYRRDAARANERNEIWIEHDGQAIVTRQVVGVLARRAVCRVQPGTAVRAGDRLGIMKFGSRMDVFLPLTATIRVARGATVRAGESVIAMLHSGSHARC